MKKYFLTAAVLLVSLSAFAQNKNNNIYIAFEGGTYSYREPHMDYPIHDYGKKYGVSVEWVGRRILENTGLMDEGDKSFASFELRYANGDVDYDGYLNSTPPTPHKTYGEPDWYVEGRITFGETYSLGRNFELWPYLGFGYRHLENDGAKVDPVSGYKRISEYCYIPIGLKLKKDFNSGLTISLTGEFDWLIVGRQRSDMEKFLPGVETSWVYNVQREGWGARFGLKVEQLLSKKFGIFVEPYYRMWKIQNSNLGTTDDYQVIGGTHYYWIVPVIEPFNITKEAGIRAGIYF